MSAPRIDLRGAVRLVSSGPPIREHGLTEAELLDAYSHLAPVDGEEVPDASV